MFNVEGCSKGPHWKHLYASFYINLYILELRLFLSFILSSLLLLRRPAPPIKSKPVLNSRMPNLIYY